MTSIVAHYQELALKGRNRPWFQRKLVRNLHMALAGLGVQEIRTLMGRLLIVLGRADATDEVRERVRHVFGIANFAMAGRAPADAAAIGDAVLRDLPAHDVASFCVRVRRADKQFPLSSPQLECEVGGRVQDARGWKVDLDRPALHIRIEVVPGEAFYSFGNEPGAGGLPSGTGGRLVALLSGGIDSPVAAWRMMKRGCRVTLVHFHSHPFLTRTSQEKARQLAEILTRYQLRTQLQMVPFGELQRQVTLSVPGSMRVIVYRRLMMRIAETIAGRIGARALVTGDVVGQVASQTLDNIAVVSEATTLPVFRPLIGMDKEEIVAEAERLGTYPVSIVPDEDCCTLFTPRHPETHANIAVVREMESKLPIDEMVRAAIAEPVVDRLVYPPSESSKFKVQSSKLGS
jgi:thiamine biosynthesis protein ThiI